MPEWSDGYVKSSGLKIHYYRTGGDKPVVILNHGAGDDGLCWTHVAKALEDDYDIIMPDARGHGKSASGRGAYSTALRVADLANLIQELKLDPPVVGGHSLGADTALNFAVLHPTLTRGVILEDPPIYLPGETLTVGETVVDQDELGKKMVTAMRVFKFIPNWLTVPTIQKAQPSYPNDEIIPMANAQKRVKLDFVNHLIEVARDMSDPIEIFSKVPVPVLLIIGDKERMSIVSQEAGRQAMKINEKVEVVHLAGAGHNIRRDRFDGYLPALQGFLQKIYGTNASSG